MQIKTDSVEEYVNQLPEDQGKRIKITGNKFIIQLPDYQLYNLFF